VLDDARAARDREAVRRVVLCSGKVWTDVEGDQRRAADDSLALIRVELLHPFPSAEINAILDAYPNLREVTWLQEEPRNMGAWRFVESHLRDLIAPEVGPRYIGRPATASPAEGWSDAHRAEQRRIVEAVLVPVRDQPVRDEPVLERGVSHAG
jgi:2-oxoglutarate dehydrogenase E1 component